MEFRVLGPVQAFDDGRALPLGGPKQRALLAELLLHGGAVVSRDHLIEAVWGEGPPESAAGSLQVYVHGLRRALGAERIETHGTGYRVRLDAEELDADRFELLLERAARRLAEGRPEEAEADLARALDDYLAWQQRQAECSRTASVRSPTQAAGAKESR